jgi:hypothetical protein
VAHDWRHGWNCWRNFGCWYLQLGAVERQSRTKLPGRHGVLANDNERPICGDTGSPSVWGGHCAADCPHGQMRFGIGQRTGPQDRSARGYMECGRLTLQGWWLVFDSSSVPHPCPDSSSVPHPCPQSDGRRRWGRKRRHNSGDPHHPYSGSWR